MSLRDVFQVFAHLCNSHTDLEFEFVRPSKEEWPQRGCSAETTLDNVNGMIVAKNVFVAHLRTDGSAL